MVGQTYENPQPNVPTGDEVIEMLQVRQRTKP
jgi:hypothetical protein